MLSFCSLSGPTPSTHYARSIAEMASIYDERVSACVWRRPDNSDVSAFVRSALLGLPFQLLKQLSTESLSDKDLSELTAMPGSEALVNDVIFLAGLYADLFEVKSVGLRLKTLDAAMCPRFHADQNLARLICTYEGPGTEWLEDYALDRSKLGHLANGLSDEDSGLIIDPAAKQQLSAFDVGLFKGARWPERQGRGVVHRSPQTGDGYQRLLLTIEGLE